MNKLMHLIKIMYLYMGVYVWWHVIVHSIYELSGSQLSVNTVFCELLTRLLNILLFQSFNSLDRILEKTAISTLVGGPQILQQT